MSRAAFNKKKSLFVTSGFHHGVNEDLHSYGILRSFHC